MFSYYLSLLPFYISVPIVCVFVSMLPLYFQNPNIATQRKQVSVFQFVIMCSLFMFLTHECVSIVFLCLHCMFRSPSVFPLCVYVSIVCLRFHCSVSIPYLCFHRVPVSPLYVCVSIVCLCLHGMSAFPLYVCFHCISSFPLYVCISIVCLYLHCKSMFPLYFCVFILLCLHFIIAFHLVSLFLLLSVWHCFQPYSYFYRMPVRLFVIDLWFPFCICMSKPCLCWVFFCHYVSAFSISIFF